MNNEVLISFSSELKDQVHFKLKARKIPFNTIMDADSTLISIGASDLSKVLKICCMVKSDYVVLDSINMPITQNNTL